jgi:hypothetical protein
LNQRDIGASGEYMHASYDIQKGNFVSLPYAPSVYPITDVSNIELYEYDDGNEQKNWGIVDTGLGFANVFYQNKRTNNLVVFNCVDTSINSILQRIAIQKSKGYKLSEHAATFFASTRELFENPPF